MATKPINYLSNAYLLDEIRKSKAQERITDNLARSFMLLVKRYGTRANWHGYSYNQDMQSAGLVQLCTYWANFDEAKSQNPFAYYTAVLGNSFRSVWGSEKRLTDIRDELCMAHGVAPSWNAWAD